VQDTARRIRYTGTVEDTLDKLTKRVLGFRNERNWAPYHTPKDSAISLCLEAAELLEHFQFKDKAKTNEHLKNNKSEVADELIDVLYWVLLMAHDLDIDLEKAMELKMSKNEAKYPIKK
jgi:NTP pyrophosphatase (non-canonical NTP hydrolase)